MKSMKSKVIKKIFSKTVFIGMSGGVDSSVAAGLLKKQGYNVIGIFIKIAIANDCSWRQERRSAFSAAAVLNIPLYTIDLSKDYEERVIDYMLSTYRSGQTPNPDVMCNQQIKFGIFYDWAIAHGADYVATGHYALTHQLKNQKSKAKDKNSSDDFVMCRSKDENKDQTYFLWAIDRKKLPQIIFPIGNFKKAKVRKLAKKFGLINAGKPDSQGLCFVGDFDFKKFLREKIGIKKGMVKNVQGEIIGEHHGVYLFTIGERHGFSIYKQTNEGKPYYIVAKDLVNNVLIVSTIPLTGNSDRVGEIVLENVNWLTTQPPSSHKIYQARLRHRGILTSCKVQKGTDEKWRVIFTESVTSPASGQSIVIYDKKICLGGGIIS